MDENLKKLAEALFVDNSKPLSSSSSDDLVHKLRSDDAIRLGLHSFYSILKRAVEVIQDGRFAFQSWNDSQIQAISSFAFAIASASRSLSVEQAEAILVAIVQQSVEFAVCYLETFGCNDDDHGIQNDLVHLLEIALIDEMDKAGGMGLPRSATAFVDMLPVVDCCDFVDDHIKCHLEGLRFSKEGKTLDWLLKTIASERVLPDRQGSGINGPTYFQDCSKFVFISQQWAVAHGKYIPRFIMLCNKLIKVKDVFDERMMGVSFRKRLLFTLRIFKLLGSLNKGVPYVEYEASLVKAVASFADALSSLFRVEFEFVSSHAISEGSFESIILMVVEEFLHIVQVIFNNSYVPQNVQACIVAFIMENLDSSVWRYDKSASNLKIPLAYFPRSVIYMLKLIDDLKRQKHQIFLELIDFDAELAGSSIATQNDYSSCIVHNETVSLLKKYTNEELLRLMFPASGQWVDNLMQLVLFLHSEGVKLWQKMERSSSNSAKFSCPSDVESSVCHEDEAIFGDLFCETGRSVGSADGSEQPPAAAVSGSSYHNMLIQAATELMYFLKTSVFSPELHHSLYENGCSKISTRHLDILLSLLDCHSSSEDNMSHGFTPLHGDKKIGQIHEMCFDILHTLLTLHALADSLEVYLVEKILAVENGAFNYNDRTLTLLAHTLFSRAGSVDSLLRTKIYQSYVSFIVDKAKSTSVNCPSVKDFVGTLPSLFHIEIVLMAFHLSAGEEKAALADLIFISLKQVSEAAMDLNSTQLTCWALVVSRLILILRHMIIHQQTCPTPLLLDVRSKLREAPLSGSSIPYNVSDHLSSWSSNALKNIMDGCLGEEAVLSSLTDQMIDASGSSLAREELAIDCLNLNWNDIYMTFSQVLGFWRGKRASALEDLLVERYLFSLCWDIPFIGSSADQKIVPWSGEFSLDLSDMLHFFCFSHSLLGHHVVIEKCTLFPDVVLSLLQHLDAAVSIPEDIDELGWDFLRNGMWLSLVLSFINTGLWRYCTDNVLSQEGLIWTECPFDQNNVKLAGSMISSMIEAGQFESLVSLFSFLLTKYVNIHQKAFLATLSYKQKLTPGFSPILLLKHTGIDKCLQDELLQRIGSNLIELESVLSVLSRLDATVQRKALGMLSSASSECLFHGFPFHLSAYSAVMLSSTLSIREIIFILDGLLRIQDVRGNVISEIEVLQQILDVVMNIKFDKMFECIHEKCDSIYHKLSAETESSSHSNLIIMKHMEGLLRDINAGGVGDGIVDEWMISKMIDILSSLRKDPSKSAIFQFYLGVEDVSGQINRLLQLHPGGCLVLIDALDRCYSESVNVKVLGFFADLLSSELFPDLLRRMQRKFLDKDINSLAQWLEMRLLGSLIDSGGGASTAKGCSNSLRESAMNFILCLVSSSSEQSKELLHRIFDSAVLPLDTAFLQFDMHAAKSYFNFIIQISKGEHLIKLLLTRTVDLMEKLVGNEHSLPGLKLLFGFIENILNDCSSGKISPQRTTSKCSSGTSLGVGHVAGSVGSRKNSETFILSANQEGGSASLECDATSVDDDEDDATSDGEVVSIDKDEDEDANSERVLASKVCTFTSSGSNFMEQHWYFCYTCDLTVSKGCCSVCAKVCHRGHRVVYSRSSRFFCDCGAGGVRGSNCQCLKPRKFTGSSNAPVRSTNAFQSFLPFPEDGDQLPDSDSDFEEDFCSDVDNSLKLSIPKEIQDGIPLLLEELDIESRVLNLCTSLMPSIVNRRDSDHLKDKKIMLGEDKVLSYGVDLLQLKKAYKSGSLDLKIKVDYSNAKELKSHLASGSLVKSLLSVSQRGRLAVGEGDKVAIFDVGQLIGQATSAPVTADKTNVKPLSKNVVRFEIVHLAFNPVVENYLVVSGYEDCQVLTLNPRGEVIDRLAVELALQGAYIRRVDWAPGSQVQLMVVTNKFVKIYDLSQDNISPMHYFTLPDDMIVDATLYLASQGRMFLIVLSESGSVFRLELSVKGNVGAMPLNEIVKLNGKEVHAKGSSLYFSSSYKLLFISFQDGTSVIGRLSSDAASLVDMCSVYEEQDGNLRPAAVHHWKELVAGSGLFVCTSGKSNSAVAVSMGEHELLAQSMRHTVGSTSPIVGMTAYKPLSKDKIHCLVLHDDGSLQIFSHVPLGIDAGMTAASEKVKKLGSNILSKAYAGTNPEFSLDFFEKTVCITSDVKLGGDAIRNGDSEGAKQNLVNEDGFLESPSPAGFKISVFNSNPDIVMVGFRVHVGNTSASHIPSSISIFQRVIKLDEGMRSWYDIPFTVAESLLADEEFTITVGPTFNGSTLPRIDSLEVYGRAKDEFGWKEKMDAVLDMEARALGLNPSAAASGKKCRSMQSCPIQEQAIADGLKLICKFYSLCRQQGCSRLEEARAELGKLKCKHLLEIIFERDHEPVLQASACRVLQAVFPKKEIYHQVKDTMRLLGVVKSASILSSRLGTGGSTGSWIIEEFTAQMRAVCKIALQRRSNLAYFLETNGSEVVDALMQVLWGILDFKQPDTQTMNNIVMSAVELIYCYAECLALHGKDVQLRSVAPAVALLKKLLFSSNEAVQTASSLAISSRLLQVPFPKQTMLATDDAAESVVSVPGASDVSGGNNHVMIEEDTITSSVQYCCDGCSTVPILRRRWHCTVCPDFDLCEACYEVLDADRLPAPHSRDHPMTAIPIEVESVGDGNEFHFAPDDVSDPNLLPISADGRMQNSSPSIHVLEPNDSGEFVASLTDPVSISASKRAINCLLLSELLEQLKGWMDTTSGLRAIPVMQLFYRLSSAVGGPFIDSSKPDSLDLEKLIKWFLDEIDLNKPFVAKTRSLFGEVAILVFMFFTLMLRNWHQPGSDNSMPRQSGTVDTHDKNVIQLQLPTTGAAKPLVDDHDKTDFASQLHRACDSLRQQNFVNYLMDILQQLVNIFKSPVSGESATHFNAGPGCGALLTVRRDLPAGNFLPFFSDSYAKAHRTDIFMDYHRLLLENTFRLVYTLVRPEKHEKSGEKEKVHKISHGKDLKLDGYQDVLCSYINNPHTNFVRRYARRLFLHLCGSKSHYYSVRDSWQYSSEVKRLYKHVNKSGGFQNSIPYERSVKIVKCLSTMAEVAAARPRNWQKYCLRHGDILPFLMDGVFYLGEESVIQTLKLLNLAFYTGKDTSLVSQKTESGDTGSNKSVALSQEVKKKKKGEDGAESSLEKSYLDMEAAVDVFTDRGGDISKQFIDCFLLEWNSSTVRAEAKLVLYGVWHHAKQSFKEILLTALLQKVKILPMYGQNIVEYTELVTWLLGKSPDMGSKNQTSELVDRCLTPDVVRCIFETLHSQNELLANHPNSRIYNTLSGLVEFDGYYLESEPCVACSSPEVPYSRMKLESLKSETKFTDNRIIVKCTGSYTIQTVTMNVHDARKSKSVKILNLYYNNRPVSDLSELKNNWSLWKRAKSCHLAFNQTELKVEFPIPITACNFMIELDSFYENLQALSLEPLQCPRCSRPVTDKHGICSNCHENAYQCRQCRNINYENLDSFLCNECGYSKYGRFEFNFMAKPSFTFDNMENDEDMKRGLAAIESESENAHRRYQQLLGFKKPLLKIVSSIGENDMDSQQKDSVQQMMVSLPGPSCKVNRKIALLGVLYGEKCKAAFDSVSKSVQTLQGLRKVLMNYLHQKQSDNGVASRFVVSRSPNNCYGCATTFVTQCLEILQVLARHPNSKKQLVSAGILSELFENNIHQGPKAARVQARTVLCSLSEGDVTAISELNSLIQKKVMYCLEHHRSLDIAVTTREEMLLLSEVCSLADEFWESRLRIVFQLLFSSIKLGAKHPAISEHVILPCLRIICQACTPPKPDTPDKEQGHGKSQVQTKDETITNASGLLSNVSGTKSFQDSSERNWDATSKTQDIQLLSYSEWERGASYIDFVRRQYKVSQAVKAAGQRSRPQRVDYLALKYALRWKRRVSKSAKSDLSAFELGSWVKELVLSACSQSIRSEMCMLMNLLCQSSSRRFRLLNLLISLLPATLPAGESAAEYFELLFKMIDSEDARLFLTVKGCLRTICTLITQEVNNVESLERSLHIDISQGFILHKLIELLGKFLEVPNVRSRFMRDNLLSEILEALIVIRGLIVQKTKLISDCNRLLKDLLDSLLLESNENKRQFIRACVNGLQIHGEERKGRTCLFILEQLGNLICPSKPEPVYLLVLNKAHTQEEFIRGSMTKNPYSSAEIGPLMRDVKNKICHQLDLLGLLEDDFGMELLVAGNIISLDLSIALVYEQVWKKSSQSSNSMANSTLLSTNAVTTSRDCPPMNVTYRLQGLDGEATEPMIKELEEDREESQDPEVEFAISGAVRECGGLEILLGMIQRLRDDFKYNKEQLVAVLNLLMYCCKIRENRRALLKLGALGLLLETARRAFSVDAMESAEGILLIVESLTLEANESDNISITQSALTVTSEEAGTGEQAKKIVLMFLERLSHPLGLKKSNKQQRNTEMVARILPYLTYGEPSAMDALIQHFSPYLQDWGAFDRLQKQLDDVKDESIAQQAIKQRFTLENFVRVSESLKTSSCGERLKDIILEKGITGTAIRHLKNSFGNTGQAGFRTNAEWASGLKLPSVPLILSMLRGLSTGHLPTQRCIDEEGVLPLLHALEGVSGENEIGARAENLLDTLSNKEGKGDGFLGEKIMKLRHATKDEMRRKALRKREELLQGLGMRQEFSPDGGERIVVSPPLLEGLEDVQEEEDGLACMVCREGYSLRPTDLLGAYSYSKRVNLGVGASGNPRGECVYTTVSYFNIIHFQCHQEAKRADAALKTPKKEWEGATLRNNESLCNSLFPVRGSSVPLAQYIRYVDQYWDNLSALGRADGSRLRLLTYDIVLMLARFATGASFSADSRGGGRESNSRFLPFMIQMARHLLDQGSPSQRRTMARAVSGYITSSTSDSRPPTPPGPQPTIGTEETVQSMMVNSLLSESYDSWLNHRRAFLQRGIYHAYMQHTHSRSPVRTSSGSATPERVESPGSSSEIGQNELLSIIRPMLVYTGLIEQLQQFFKVKKSAGPTTVRREGTSSSAVTMTTSTTITTEGEEESGNLENWEVAMKERLLNVKELLGFSKELLSWLDEINSASDLQEAFDIIGVLADVLSGGFTRCDDFVQAAISAGKS